MNSDFTLWNSHPKLLVSFLKIFLMNCLLPCFRQHYYHGIFILVRIFSYDSIFISKILPSPKA